ncbi:hypothetical protein KOW79_005096 [Hemibagrus wyckioides]|uniref:ADP-ribosylation factor-like protein 5A n=1 Tax=Hemibagrus wyckioides TaxID=337641 RepID=A0A9D3P245_9TELE|nr:hypothetical protein KOW79_005096 [Hemibagrus wyckioides]
MGIIFTKLWRLFNHQEHKVIIVGLDNAGKTTILYQFSMNEVVHTSPTIGSNVEEIVVNNTHFLMWDIGGQESLRSSWNTYYTNTEFVIVVVDSTDRERISVTREELYRMLAHEDLKKAGLLVFANKQDVKGCMTVAEISQSLQLTSVKDHQWHIQACCALTGEGLCQGLEWMMSRLRRFSGGKSWGGSGSLGNTITLNSLVCRNTLGGISVWDTSRWKVSKFFILLSLDKLPELYLVRSTKSV